MTVAKPATNPCGTCPYRKDVPSGIWAAEEYEKLKAYDRETWEQPTGLFLCHQHDRNSDRSQLCAGWVACHGPENLLGIRLAPMNGMAARDLAATYEYTTNVPVFNSGHDAAEHGMQDINTPSLEASRAITKITKRRSDLRPG